MPGSLQRICKALRNLHQLLTCVSPELLVEYRFCSMFLDISIGVIQHENYLQSKQECIYLFNQIIFTLVVTFDLELIHQIPLCYHRWLLEMTSPKSKKSLKSPDNVLFKFEMQKQCLLVPERDTFRILDVNARKKFIFFFHINANYTKLRKDIWHLIVPNTLCR